MSANPLVSIIIPVYKVENYIERCLDSIRAIDYSPIEVILVDDASPDRSGEILDRYHETDPDWIIVHKKVNEGVARARITGVEKATGDFVMFVDSDDYIHPSIISKMIPVAVETQADVVLCGYYVDDGKAVVPDSRRVDRVFDRDEIEKLLDDCFLFDIDLGKAVLPVFLWGKIFRNQAEALAASMEEGVDLDFEQDLIAYMAFTVRHTNKIACISDPLYYYVIRPGQSTSRHPVTLFERRILLWQKLDKLGGDRFRNQLSYRMWFFVKKALYSKYSPGSFRDYRLFVKYVRSIPVIKKYIFGSKIRDLHPDIKKHPHFLLVKCRLYFLDYLFSAYARKKGRGL